MIDLKKAPFYLDERGMKWVRETLTSLTRDEKIGQLFCVLFKELDEREYDTIHSILSPGSCMYRPTGAEKALRFSNRLNEEWKVPPLIAANLEKGGVGIVDEGTLLGSNMEVAATGDPALARKLGEVCAGEAAAVGANLAFAPIIDIDYNFHNPITNTRTFGSDPALVASMGVAYLKAVQERGIAATIKHFPGDGFDERDQHLVTSVNSMGCEEWMATYGAVYKTCIAAGALCCMTGHIMQPAWSKRLNHKLRDEELMPASLSHELQNGLLRKELGFNGLIITDATTMAGYTLAMSRRDAVPCSIAAGADVFLFARNLAEDFAFMKQGVENGIITEERLDEAVTRILAVKAALGLHEKREPLTLANMKQVVGCATYNDWAKECADRAITLVKEQTGVLPITNEKYKRILFYPIEQAGGGAAKFYSVAPTCKKVVKMLKSEGFQVDVFEPPTGNEGFTPPYMETVNRYDLILYVANITTKSNQTVVRIEWKQPMGADCGHYINDVPTVFISLENPYHLIDFPRVKTYINCYSGNDNVLKALLDKLTGKSEFKGVSPIDPFCGKWDARL
jgi:beta-N-acetylhexosaminidase